MANLMIFVTKKLIENNAIIFTDSHEGFAKDI